jgi:hypothetical protein
MSTPWIEIAHDDGEDLAGDSGVALGHVCVARRVAVRARGGCKARAAAADQPSRFGRRDAILE